MNPEMIVKMGDCYYNGSDGYARDAHKALEYYRQAAGCGYHWGYYNVGKCYLEGQGVEKNDDEARVWFRKAEEAAGNPWATYWLAEMGDSAAAFRVAEYYATGCYEGLGMPKDEGKAESFRNWGIVKKGDCYYNGSDGYARDAHKALEYYRQAAGCGYHWGYYNVGKCYLEGQGVEKNDDEARVWFRKAEETAGNPWATYWLALMGDSAAALRVAEYYATGCCAEGWGMPKDEGKAEYFRNHGLWMMVKTGDSYYNGSDGYPRDAHKALEYYRKSADCGFHWGYFNVGKCYLEGQGVEKNDDEARKWYREAERIGDNPWATYWLAELGDSAAALRMAEYYATGSREQWGVQRDESKAEHFRNLGQDSIKEDYSYPSNDEVPCEWGPATIDIYKRQQDFWNFEKMSTIGKVGMIGVIGTALAIEGTSRAINQAIDWLTHRDDRQC